jgi:hypothetical protein
VFCSGPPVSTALRSRYRRGLQAGRTLRIQQHDGGLKIAAVIRLAGSSSGHPADPGHLHIHSDVEALIHEEAIADLSSGSR